MAKFCARCGKELKPGGKFCMSCGAPVRSAGDRNIRNENIRNENIRRPNTRNKKSGNTYSGYEEIYNKREAASYRTAKAKKGTRIKIPKTLVLLAAILVCVVLIKKVYFPSKEALIGNWVAPGTTNQVLEIRTEELRFNGRRYDYTVEGNVLHLTQTFPSSSSGEMPFKLRGDTLTIDLGTEFFGVFYGRSGTVKLERDES